LLLLRGIVQIGSDRIATRPTCRPPLPQQLPLFPRSAACPYFSLTIFLDVCPVHPRPPTLCDLCAPSSVTSVLILFSRPISPASYPGLNDHAVLPASLHNILRLQRLVPRAALRIQKLQQVLQRFRCSRCNARTYSPAARSQSPSFFSLSRWCESVELGSPNSPWIVSKPPAPRGAPIRVVA